MKEPINWAKWAFWAGLLSCIGNFILVVENYWNGHSNWPF